MEKKKPNYNIFLPLGIIFLGAGVVFLAAVNPGIGAAFIGLGGVYIIISIRKGQGNKKKDGTESK